MRITVRQRKPGEIAPPVKKGSVRIRVVQKSGGQPTVRLPDGRVVRLPRKPVAK
jgi:hypothetical protein